MVLSSFKHMEWKMPLILLSFLSVLFIAPAVAQQPDDTFLIETKFVLESPPPSESEISAKLSNALNELFNDFGNAMGLEDNFTIEVLMASIESSTGVTTANYSVNTTSSNTRLKASYAILVLGSLSNATYAINLNKTLSVKDVLQKANPVGAASPTQGVMNNEEKYVKTYGVDLILIPKVMPYDPAFADSLREMFSSVGVNVTILVHSFLSLDKEVELVFTVHLWSDGTTMNSAYASGTVWSNRFALDNILLRNTIGNNTFDKAYRLSEAMLCNNVTYLSFADLLRDPSVDTNAALSQETFIKDISKGFLNSSDSSPSPPVVCYVFASGVLTVTVGITHSNSTLKVLDLLNLQGFCREVLGTRTYNSMTNRFHAEMLYNSSGPLGTSITNINQCSRTTEPPTTVSDTTTTTTATNETTSSTTTCAPCACDCLLITLLWVFVGLLILCIIILIVVILILLLRFRTIPETGPITEKGKPPEPIPTQETVIDGQPDQTRLSPLTTPLSKSLTPSPPPSSVTSATSSSRVAPAPPDGPVPITPAFVQLIRNQSFFLPVIETQSLVTSPTFPSRKNAQVQPPNIGRNTREEWENPLDGPCGLNVPQAHGRASRPPRYRGGRESQYITLSGSFTH